MFWNISWEKSNKKQAKNQASIFFEEYYVQYYIEYSVRAGVLDIYSFSSLKPPYKDEFLNKTDIYLLYSKVPWLFPSFLLFEP